jgi:predicted transcriptional regulator of viral defense system
MSHGIGWTDKARIAARASKVKKDLIRCADILDNLRHVPTRHVPTRQIVARDIEQMFDLTPSGARCALNRLVVMGLLVKVRRGVWERRADDPLQNPNGE